MEIVQGNRDNKRKTVQLFSLKINDCIIESPKDIPN